MYDKIALILSFKGSLNAGEVKSLSPFILPLFSSYSYHFTLSIPAVRLYLLDYGEVYTVNLPNAYARSILTVPWLELGGKCHIECLQNGYTADVEFHCKVRVRLELYFVTAHYSGVGPGILKGPSTVHVYVHVQWPCPVYCSGCGRHYVGNDVVDESQFWNRWCTSVLVCLAYINQWCARQVARIPCRWELISLKQRCPGIA